jgi:hypothetical protein
MFDVPVGLIIFRRPQFTERVLQVLALIRPRKLFVIADGPRPDKPGEAEACQATRAVIDRIDWDCDVIKNYSEVNLGCGRRPATGITWLFEQVEEAIILEDDCVPDPSFFRFCEEMLERYRDDERVMHIGGSTYQRENFPVPESYFFSCFNGAWGWATWRRAWKYFDMAVKHWPRLRNTTWLMDILEREDAAAIWAKEFEVACQKQGEVDYWDHQWTFACWSNSGLSVRPKFNLVSNVGCCADATHTLSEADPRANLPALPMGFPLTHPPMVLPNRELDRKFLNDVIFGCVAAPNRAERIRQFLSRHTPSFAREAYRNLASSLPTGS